MARCIKNFLQNNHPLTKEYGEHIQERFDEVAEAILALDENVHPYFVFKGTSVDDSVETWFYGYDEETGERGDINLQQANTVICEFVVIEQEEVKGFVNNLDYFEKAR